jgi:hypothetical protein
MAKSLVWVMMILFLVGLVAKNQATAANMKCGSCEDCHALMRRPDNAADFLGGTSGSSAGPSLLDRRLQCAPKDEVAVVDAATNVESKKCERFCSETCRAEPPKTQSSDGEVPCVPQSKPRKLSLAQLSTAYALTGCPEPKPCMCQCWCDPIMYGTPLPAPPTPFATGAPPALSLLGKTSEKTVRAVSEDPRPIVLGPMGPPLAPMPPPPDRSYCPKSAACNCFCPCRE